MPVSPSATTFTRARQRTTVSSASTPSVLATSTRLWLSPYDADTWTTDPFDDRAALFMRMSRSTLSDFATPSGSRSTWFTARPVVDPSRCRPFVLGIDLGEVTAGSHCRPQHPFQHVVINHDGQPILRFRFRSSVQARPHKGATGVNR